MFSKDSEFSKLSSHYSRRKSKRRKTYLPNVELSLDMELILEQSNTSTCLQEYRCFRAITELIIWRELKLQHPLITQVGLIEGFLFYEDNIIGRRYEPTTIQISNCPIIIVEVCHWEQYSEWQPRILKKRIEILSLNDYMDSLANSNEEEYGSAIAIYPLRQQNSYMSFSLGTLFCVKGDAQTLLFIISCEASTMLEILTFCAEMSTIKYILSVIARYIGSLGFRAHINAKLVCNKNDLMYSIERASIGERVEVKCMLADFCLLDWNWGELKNARMRMNVHD